MQNLNQQAETVGGTTNLYDVDGNLVSSTIGGQTSLYKYDIENRLIGVTSPAGNWTYEYDAIGNRSATVENGVRTDYLVDPLGIGSVIAEYDATGLLLARYTYGFGLTSQTSGGDSYYFDFDALGSTAAVTSAGTEVNSYQYLVWCDAGKGRGYSQRL